MKEKNNFKKKKKILIIIKKILICLTLVGITISTIPSVEYENAYNYYKNSLPPILENETQKDYTIRLYKEALNANKKLSEPEKKKLEETFIELVLNDIGEYFEDSSLAKMMATASTQNVKELTSFEKKFSWYQGFYNPYLNELIIDTNIDDVDPTLLAHEQLHAILQNSFYKKAYALNEIITKNSVKGDDSYYYLNTYFNVLNFVIGKKNLYKYYLNSDIEGLKDELSRYLSPEEVNTLIISYDDLIFSHYYTSFLSRLGQKPSTKTLKEREQNETISESLLVKLYEKKFDVSLQNSSLGQVLFGYYTPSIKGLTYIKNTIGYYEPICKLEEVDDTQVKVIITFLTSNIDPNTKDFYQVNEEYILSKQDFATIDLEILFKDAYKKHQNELLDKKLDKKFRLS